MIDFIEIRTKIISLILDTDEIPTLNTIILQLECLLHFAKVRLKHLKIEN